MSAGTPVDRNSAGIFSTLTPDGSTPPLHALFSVLPHQFSATPLSLDLYPWNPNAANYDGLRIDSSTIPGDTTLSAVGLYGESPSLNLAGTILINGVPISGNQLGKSALDFGAVADFAQTGATITISGGSLNQGTLSAVPGSLNVGQTMVIDTLTGPLVVQSISAAGVVTFTSNASGSTSSAMCCWGTDNTNALNAFFSYISVNNVIGILPAGKFLITNTIGLPDIGVEQNCPTIYCGGATQDPNRLADIAINGGTAIIWGGALNGIMSSWNRVSSIHWVGGLTLSGQPAYDPAGTYTPYANQAGIGYLLAQTNTPVVGTGYHLFDTLVVQNLDVGVQFAVGQSDNNCDTTRFTRFIARNCTAAFIGSGGQQMAYTVGFAHLVSTQRGFALLDAGDLDVQQLNLSHGSPQAARTDAGATAGTGVSVVLDPAIRYSDSGRTVTGTGISTNPVSCVGTVTPGVSFTLVSAPGGASAVTTGNVSGITLGTTFTGIEGHGGINSSNIHVALLRAESGSYQSVYAGGNTAICIDSWEEAFSGAANLNQLYVDGGSGPATYGGTLKIGQMVLYSFNAAASALNSPIFIGGVASKQGHLMVDQAVFYGTSNNIAALTNYFFAGPDALADITIRSLRDTADNVYNPINTRIQEGPSFCYGQTTNAATAVRLLHAGLPLSCVYGRSPKIPLGAAVILVTIIGDRGDGTFTYFQRTVTTTRFGAGAATIAVTTPTGWTDSVQGTDQITSITIDATTQVLDIQMQGTVSQTINWQATVALVGWTQAIDK